MVRGFERERLMKMMMKPIRMCYQAITSLKYVKPRTF